MFESELCEKCGGLCCKHSPGRFAPDDLIKMSGSIYDAALVLFRSGNYVIDQWEGDPRPDIPDCGDCEDVDCGVCPRLSRVPVIRPRAENDDGELWSRASYRGRCTFLTDNGCVLDPDLRPHECRYLEPGKGLGCTQHGGSVKEIAIMWIPHIQDVERAALDYEEDK